MDVACAQSVSFDTISVLKLIHQGRRFKPARAYDPLRRFRMREPEFVILRQLLKTSGDVRKGRHLAADLMPGALTQDPTSMAMTPERRSRQAELEEVDPARASACAGPSSHGRAVLP